MNKERILIVDDEPIIVELFQAVLQDLGKERAGKGWEIEIETALSGDEAWEKILAKSDFQIVITDVTMPGMSGLELYKKIRSEFPLVKIIVISGQEVPPEVEEHCVYIAKPVSISHLKACVVKLLV